MQMVQVKAFFFVCAAAVGVKKQHGEPFALVAVIRKNRIVLKKTGTTYIKIRIFGDRNHGIIYTQFRLRVKKASGRQND